MNASPIRVPYMRLGKRPGKDRLRLVEAVAENLVLPRL